jgi:hypothetical protein
MSVLEDRLGSGRRHCSERRRYLAGLESLAEQLRADERRLRAEIAGTFADWQVPEEGAGRPGFARPLIERHSKLARSVAAIDAQIAEVGAELGAAEQELKRHEHAAARHARSSPDSRQAAPPIADPERAG